MCSVDSYYAPFLNNISGACSYCDHSYLGAHTPTNCSNGSIYVSDSECNACSYQGLPGIAKMCAMPEPTLDLTAMIQCCTNTVPETQPLEGYCGSDWCQGSTTCSNFLNSHCGLASNIANPECIQYCNSEAALSTGACNAAVKAYCNISENTNTAVCGCSMPENSTNYPGFAETEPSIPIACYNSCENTDAIRLSTTQSCDVQDLTVCVVEGVDVDAISSSVGNITIQQNCGNTTSSGGTTTKIINKVETVAKNKWVWLGVGIFFVIILLLIIVSVHRSHSSDTNDTDSNSDDTDNSTDSS